MYLACFNKILLPLIEEDTRLYMIIGASVNIATIVKDRLKVRILDSKKKLP
jgi:hypothetical protein